MLVYIILLHTFLWKIMLSWRNFRALWFFSSPMYYVSINVDNFESKIPTTRRHLKEDIKKEQLMCSAARLALLPHRSGLWLPRPQNGKEREPPSKIQWVAALKSVLSCKKWHFKICLLHPTRIIIVDFRNPHHKCQRKQSNSTESIS